MVSDLIENINTFITIWFVFPAILILGGYLTYKLRCIQLTKVSLSAKMLFAPSGNREGNITPFQAVSAVLAGNLGTGNISGMAVALTCGGPGALVWMWIMAFLGSAIQYANCLLGTKFRVRNSQGEFSGGPMFYLRDGLKSKTLAYLFCIFTIFAAFTVGNLVQIHSIVLPLETAGYNPLHVGIVLAGVVAIVILGGIERFARVAASIVPFKAFLYLGCAGAILFLNASKLPEVFFLLFTTAQSSEAMVSGFLGFMTVKAITTGFGRGLFATDAGTGIVPILQATAQTESPVMTGINALLAPVVTMLVCTATALVLLVTGAWQTGLESTNMVTYAFESGLGASFGKYIVIVSLVLFAYTTVLAWACCMDKSVEFLLGRSAILPLRLIFILFVPVGTLLHVSIVWALADVCISLMLLVNLIGIVRLIHTVINDTNAHFEPVSIKEII